MTHRGRGRLAYGFDRSAWEAGCWFFDSWRWHPSRFGAGYRQRCVDVKATSGDTSWV